MFNTHHHFANFFKKKEEKSIQPYAYAVSKKLAQGSICLDLNEIREGETEQQEDSLEEWREFHLSDLSSEDLKSQIADGNGISDLVGSENDVKKPFILHGDNFYITRYFNYETQIIESINSLISKGKLDRQERLKDLKASPQLARLVEGKETSVEVGTDWQLLASAIAYLNNFTIITGGPGTGKTTTVAKVLSLLYEENPKLIVKLAAPTGKAAMRMKESLANNAMVPSEFRKDISELKPYTIHRLLEYKHQSPYFKRNSENPVEADVIIVDEASMIDVALFAKLIAAVSPETRLILLGDQNQLASVEAGSLLGDLCNTVKNKNHFSENIFPDLKGILPQLDLKSNPKEDELLQDHLVELQHSYRFVKKPELGDLSKAMISNDIPTIEKFFDGNRDEKAIIVDQEYKESICENFIKGFEAYISEKDVATAIEKLNELRILAVIREGNQGVAGLNARVEKYLAKKGKINLSQVFYENRPVIVTRNHSDLNLFNGDVGIVRKDKDGKMRIWFLDEEKQLDDERKKTETGADGAESKEAVDKKVRSFSPGLLTDVETVFAMTVHKSQGSEFEKVLLVMPKSEELPLLTRELLYTGITRAKEKLKIQGTKEIILKASEGRVMRASGITNRI
ncbi:exodeoxyribonuclease V subunit alpha [Salegentibacter sp. BDJ18]|uniref:exodeoxyribonuclease V subunit alpha n=1 Tax=Salegentibacter sp. BDJ18 TaxID=2816376 RepID=UPI001AAE62CD|nr:exodeoxyribonuclease V subunit alpha [Salegentibacter sp. BDJ18]MBO2546022.1 exodeoxyribonuclease V subunit alpha [Salegentibacter sp. BDJ18]